MENASKALIMAASVLLGVMIISVIVYMFSLFGSYSADASKTMSDAQIAQFNNQFLKYYGSRQNEDTKKDEPILCTAHDIMTIANLAKYNNQNYDLLNERSYSEDTFYIQVDITNGSQSNVEKWTENKQIQFLQANSITEKTDTTTGEKIAEKIHFICEKVNINSQTKRVNYIVFKRL